MAGLTIELPLFPSSPSHPTLLHYAAAVLNTHDAVQKSDLTLEAHHFYHHHSLPVGNDLSVESLPFPPEKPARPQHLTSLLPQDMPKPVKNDANGNRIRLIHSFCHIESYAIDLSWDMLVRFVKEGALGVHMPKEFYEDWLRIAAEEAKHFTLWFHRLKELNSFYGALPVHEGLWQSATDTSADLLARLAVVHAVHEARGLDTAPKSMAQLASFPDKKSAEMLAAIEVDELTHVASGVRWFKYVCEKAEVDPIPLFHQLVRRYFHGALKPPFNVEARSKAGFTPEWYEPLVTKDKTTTGQVAPVEKEETQTKKEAAKGNEKDGTEQITEQVQKVTVS